jgi:hypothetical protein
MRAREAEKAAVLATFSVQIARFSRETRFFARKLGQRNTYNFAAFKMGCAAKNFVPAAA